MIDESTISFMVGLCSVVLVLISRFYKIFKKKEQLEKNIITDLILAYLAGILIVPGIRFMNFTFNLDETCTQLAPYKEYLGLAGVVLVLAAGYLLVELIFNKADKNKKE